MSGIVRTAKAARKMAKSRGRAAVAQAAAAAAATMSGRLRFYGRGRTLSPRPSLLEVDGSHESCVVTWDSDGVGASASIGCQCDDFLRNASRNGLVTPENIPAECKESLEAGGTMHEI